MARPSRYSPEVRERSVRMVLEHQGEHDSQWAAIGSIAAKIGCAGPASFDGKGMSRWPFLLKHLSYSPAPIPISDPVTGLGFLPFLMIRVGLPIGEISAESNAWEGRAGHRFVDAGEQDDIRSAGPLICVLTGPPPTQAPRQALFRFSA